MQARAGSGARDVARQQPRQVLGLGGRSVSCIASSVSASLAHRLSGLRVASSLTVSTPACSIASLTSRSGHCSGGTSRRMPGLGAALHDEVCG